MIDRSVKPMECKRMRWWVSMSLALTALAFLAGCGLLFPGAFQAEAVAVTKEATQRFPPGSSAAAFEEWFVAKAGAGLSWTPQRSREQTDPQCEMREAAIERPEYCMNVLSAKYCVDPSGAISSLEMRQRGYC